MKVAVTVISECGRYDDSYASECHLIGCHNQIRDDSYIIVDGCFVDLCHRHLAIKNKFGCCIYRRYSYEYC